MPVVWFIRHAESEANAGLATSRPAEIGLTDRGRGQAELIAQALPEAPSLLITSRYLRTAQTAQPTLQRFPHVHHEQWEVHEFTYLSSFNNIYTTIRERRPRVDAYWQRSDPLYVDGAGAESFAGFIERVHMVLQQLCSAHEQYIVMFSHEQFIRAAMWLLLFRPQRITATSMMQFRAWASASPLPNGAILPVAFHLDTDVHIGEIATAHLSTPRDAVPHQATILDAEQKWPPACGLAPAISGR